MGPITFVRLCRGDFALLTTWLTEPLVARWWNHETSASALERDYGAVVDGSEPTSVLIAELEGRPFGLIQHYPVAAYPDYLAELAGVCEVPEGAVSVDYLIGEEFEFTREELEIRFPRLWKRFGKRNQTP